MNDEFHRVTPDTGRAIVPDVPMVARLTHKQRLERARVIVSGSLIRWRNKRTEGRCRMCQRIAAVRPLTEHHVVPLSWFTGTSRQRILGSLRNVSANKVPLCRPCHDLVEDGTAVHELRRLLAPDEITFVIQTAGEQWLNEHYPANPRRKPTPLNPARAARRARKLSTPPRQWEQHARGCHVTYGCVYGCRVNGYGTQPR